MLAHAQFILALGVEMYTALGAMKCSRGVLEKSVSVAGTAKYGRFHLCPHDFFIQPSQIEDEECIRHIRLTAAFVRNGSRSISSVVSSQRQVPPSYIRSNGQIDHRLYQVQVRHMSAPGKRNFIASLYENIKQEMTKNKEMKENLKKFREEAEKLEQSDALKKARQKYEAIEGETSKGTEVLKKRLSELQDKVKDTLSEAEKTELAKRGKELAEEVSRTAGKAAETISKGGEQLSQTRVYRSVTEGVKSVKEEFDEVTLSRAYVYKKPEKLRKRVERHGAGNPDDDKPIEADTETTGMELHKDSRWYQSWQSFKDNNQYVHKMFDLKMKYDESDHVLVRATRTFTDKFTELFGGVFSKTEMSQVLTEICKMDPNFDKELFIKDCQNDIIPNVLEAINSGNLEVLKDWCHEGAYNVLAHPIQQAQKAGYRMDYRVLDVNQVDIAAGQMMEQGPVLVITFNAQQVMVIRDKAGKVVEGDPDKIIRMFYVWALCRDQTILDPRAAWRIVDMSSSPSEQWL